MALFYSFERLFCYLKAGVREFPLVHYPEGHNGEFHPGLPHGARVPNAGLSAFPRPVVGNWIRSGVTDQCP